MHCMEGQDERVGQREDHAYRKRSMLCKSRVSLRKYLWKRSCCDTLCRLVFSLGASRVGELNRFDSGTRGVPSSSVSVSVSVRSSSDSVAVSPSVTAGVGASVEATEEVDACLLWVASELASDDLRAERGWMGERAARGLRWPYVRSMSATNTW